MSGYRSWGPKPVEKPRGPRVVRKPEVVLIDEPITRQHERDELVGRRFGYRREWWVIGIDGSLSVRVELGGAA